MQYTHFCFRTPAEVEKWYEYKILVLQVNEGIFVNPHSFKNLANILPTMSAQGRWRELLSAVERAGKNTGTNPALVIATTLYSVR